MHLRENPITAVAAPKHEAAGTSGRVLTPRHVGILLAALVMSVPVVGWAIEVGVALTPSHLIGFSLLAIAVLSWLTGRFRLPWDAGTISVVVFVLVAAV